MLQKYDHPEITAILFGPMGGRNSEVPLYISPIFNTFTIKITNWHTKKRRSTGNT